MFRTMLITAAAVSLLSGAAVAQTMSDEGTKTVITKSTPGDMGTKKVVIKRYMTPYGALVTKRKSIHDGFSGSSVTRIHRTWDPMTGETRIHSRTFER